MQIIAGFLLAIAIAALAWRLGALSASGAWAAVLTGGLTFGFGGLPWAALLLVFFISSSALSRLFARRKAAVNEKFSKGSRRDWAQVLANGGLGTLLVLLHTWLPAQAWLWVAYMGAMAAVNADTWATELGVLSPGLPRRITTGRPVERGTSGAVSLLGSLAALGGALLVGLVAALFAPGQSPMPLIAAAGLGGLAGSLLDSFLGATVQVIYWCPACGKETERHPFHSCGTPTTPLRGWPWMSNDLVNLACSAGGAAASWLIWRLLH